MNAIYRQPALNLALVRWLFLLRRLSAWVRSWRVLKLAEVGFVSGRSSTIYY